MVEGELGERLYVHSDQIDRPLLMRKDGEHYNIMTDHLGSTLGLVSEAGDVVEQYAYNAFGEMKIFDGQGAEIPASTLGNIYGFTGREMDSESDFYYYRARYYNPQTGRFLSEDPIRFASGDFNQYRYVGNNPLDSRDPSGSILIGELLALGATPFIISSILQTNTLTNQILQLEASIDRLSSQISALQSQQANLCAGSEQANSVQRRINIARAQVVETKKQIFEKRKRRNVLVGNTVVSAFLDAASGLGFSFITDF